MDLTALLARPESKSLEFKRDLSSPEGALRTVVAFANTAGGTLLVGVEDRTRDVRGVPQPMDVEERLASLVGDSILPRLVPDIEIVPWRKTHVLALHVYPSGSRPHYLKRAGLERGTYVRVGSTNRRADADLIEEMRRFVRGETFDEQALPELDSEALDFRAAVESFAGRRRLTRRDLETLRLVTTHQRRKVPTVGGLLLFGRSRAREFPDAWIQAGRFGGTDRAHIVDQLAIHEHLPAAIEAALAFVDKHTQRGLRIRATRHEVQPSLPPLALREALINAVAHADYSQRGAPIRVAVFDDRVEIESPGLLPFGLTVEDVQRGTSKLRNRIIGRVFHELGLIEQWGSGIQRMTAACRDAGLAAPQLEELGTRFRVTLSMQPTRNIVVDAVDRVLLEALRRNDGLATSEIAAHIGLSARATRTRLAALVARGLVTELGSNRRDPRRRYFLARAERD